MKKTIGIVALIMLLAAPLLLHFEWRESYRCILCLSSKTRREWRLGTMPLGHPIVGVSPDWDRAIRLTPPAETVIPSVAVRLFPPEHRHEWRFAQASPYYLFGTRWAGCELGSSRQLSPFAYAYLRNAAFREHADHLIRSGKLSATEAMILFTFEPALRGRRDPRFLRGAGLVRDFQAGNPNPMFDEAFESGFGGH